jgi:hypothetical protein
MAQRFVSGPESPLEGVSAAAWQRFISALEVQPVGQVSDSGGLGAFDMRPRRLVELGYATNLRRIDNRQCCDFTSPWSQSRFLADLFAQHTVLSKSMRSYYDALRRGELVKPKEVSMSGALAVLHIGGRGALAAWPKLFTNTRALYDATRGAF